MVIRKIERTDLDRVSSICISAFMGSIAPSLTEEGIDTFKNIASVDGFISRMEADNEMLAYPRTNIRSYNQCIIGAYCSSQYQFRKPLLTGNKRHVDDTLDRV
jgi:hypothetical protein